MKSEFLESELELYVQRLLIHESYSTGNRYKMLKISPNDERLKGYDAKIIGMTPFYCQFKTSDFLTKGNLYDRRQKFCKMTGWPKSSFYTFSLRVPNAPEDKKKPNMWQHNVLHSLWKSNPSAVAYVAPMFHTRTELDLHEPLNAWGCCFLDSQYSRRRDGHRNSGILIQAGSVNGHDRCRLPFFDGLISIPPHVAVQDLKHSYCFNSPSDVSFHSEPEQIENASTFDERLHYFVFESIKGEAQKVSDLRMTLSDVRNLIAIEEKEADFLESFLAFGLVQAGASNHSFRLGAATYFESEASWLQQRIAFSAALNAYFGISTLGLMKFVEN